MKTTLKFLLYIALASLAACQGQVQTTNNAGNGEKRDNNNDDDNTEGEDETEYKLFVRISGVTNDASGVVKSDPAGIDCGADCSLVFDEPTTLNLTATPSGASEFVGWSDIASSSLTRAVTVDGVKSVTAIFASGPQFNVEFAGTGRGTVATASAKFNCDNIMLYRRGKCFAPLSSVTSETFTATPTAGSTFAGWSEASCGMNPTCSVTVSGQNKITATFTDSKTIPSNVGTLLYDYCVNCHASAWNIIGALRIHKSDLVGRISSGNMPRGASYSADQKNTIIDFLNTL